MKDNIEQIRHDLNRLSFTQVIQKEGYAGQSWTQRKAFIQNNVGCCTRCEACNIHLCPDDPDFRLHFVSHGSHALDFCESMGDVSPDDSWNDIPVLFLFENPSIQYGRLYGEPIAHCGGKRPAQLWYSIHDGYEEYREDRYDYPNFFRQGCYGDLTASLIRLFKLRNAYMTNFIKCSMNDANGTHYQSTCCYPEACISTCFHSILKEEIKLLMGKQDKLIVFAFSQRVYKLAQTYFDQADTLRGKYDLCLLPHPAKRISNDERKYVLFAKIFKVLTNNGIPCEAALEEFLKKDTAVDNDNILDR